MNKLDHENLLELTFLVEHVIYELKKKLHRTGATNCSFQFLPKSLNQNVSRVLATVSRAFRNNRL